MHRTAYALLLLTTLFWGGNAVAGKLAVGHISPFVLTTLRWALAALVMGMIGWRQLARDWPVARPNLLFLFILGTVGFSAFNGTMYLALNHTSAINVSIEQAGVPMVIFIANFLLFRFGVTWAQIAGFIISIIGVAMVASHGEFQRLVQLQLNLGDALMLLAILFYGGYTVALRFKPDINWQSLMLILAGSAFVSSLPFSVWELNSGDGIIPDSIGWATVIYTAIFPSILGQVFFIRGNELIGGNRAGLFINLVPIFGTLLSVLILREAFHAYHAIALVLVLGGIWLAENSGRKAAG